MYYPTWLFWWLHISACGWLFNLSLLHRKVLLLLHPINIIGLNFFPVKIGHLKKYFIYLFLERGERRKKGRETSMCKGNIGCLSHAPSWGPGPQPRHVPWLGIEPVAFQFTGWCLVHWATPAREKYDIFCDVYLIPSLVEHFFLINSHLLFFYLNVHAVRSFFY